MRPLLERKPKAYILWLIAGAAASVVVAVGYYRVHDISILGTAFAVFCSLMGLLDFLRNHRR